MLQAQAIASKGFLFYNQVLKAPVNLGNKEKLSLQPYGSCNPTKN